MHASIEKGMDVDSPSFLVKGHSEFWLRRLLNGNIQKLAGLDNMKRLKAQCHKQKEFVCPSTAFTVCPVLNEFESSEAYGFEMPFCRGEVAPEYIDRASPYGVRRFISHLIDLIEGFIAESEIKNLDAGIISNKSIKVLENIKGNSNVPASALALIDKHIYLIQKVGSFEIPIGKCHGDLTLSNIIFDDFNDRYFLIDFLDSYIESPILDLAKISQEVKLQWTSKLMSQTHDVQKYLMVMNTLDLKIQKHFSKYEWFVRYQSIFDFQNLIRLLPYASDKHIIEAILRRLNLILIT